MGGGEDGGDGGGLPCMPCKCVSSEAVDAEALRSTRAGCPFVPQVVA